MLIVNTYNSNIPIITNSAGKVEHPIDDFMFVFGDETQAYASCSVTWRGQFFIYGGYDLKTQISTLNGCKLENVATLNFEFQHGSCANMNDEQLFLCFSPEDSTKLCRSSESPTGHFEKITECIENHKYGGLAASSGEMRF